MSNKFVVFYVTVISVTLVISLYASHLNPTWNHMVFTFPPETQKVIENRTARMEIWWRWLSDSLEMTVKVNDDDCNKTLIEIHNTDRLGLLLDSDHSGNLSLSSMGNELEELDDHGVFVTNSNISYIFKRCFVVVRIPGYTYWYYTGAVMPSPEYTDFVDFLNDSYCIHRQGEGYTFKLSIPKKLINVEPPTLMYVSFSDYNVIWNELGKEKSYQDTIAAEFKG